MLLIASVQNLVGIRPASRREALPDPVMPGATARRPCSRPAPALSGVASVRSIPASPYSEFRNHLQTGDLLFGAGRYPFSRLIRAVTRSPWTHVGVILRDEWSDELLVLESIETRGVRLVRLSDFFDNYRDGRPYEGDVVVARHTQVEPDSEALRALVRRGLALIGPSNGLVERCAITLRLLWGAGADPERRTALMSAELVDACFSHRDGGRYPAFRGAHDGFVSPASLWSDPRVLPMRRLLPDSSRASAGSDFGPQSA